MAFANGLKPQPSPFWPGAFWPPGVPLEDPTDPTDPGEGGNPGEGYVPVPTAPAGMVAVFFRPTFLRVPANADASLYYVDNERPYSPDSTELTRLSAKFKKDAPEPETPPEEYTAYNVYSYVLVPLPVEGETEPVIYATFCPAANLDPLDVRSRWRMLPTLAGRDYWFEDELRALYQAELADPPTP